MKPLMHAHCQAIIDLLATEPMTDMARLIIVERLHTVCEHMSFLEELATFHNEELAKLGVTDLTDAWIAWKEKNKPIGDMERER